jgi:peptidoglycan/LPS O-acetylase OafA/YrhL
VRLTPCKIGRALFIQQKEVKAGSRGALPAEPVCGERFTKRRQPLIEARGNTARLGSVDLLRCVAGTAVLWLHLTESSHNPTLKAAGKLGWVGVEIFFVVSGFVIPFAMYRAGYRLPNDAIQFVTRRLVRLDPPYFVASAFAALLSYAAWKTPGFRGPEPTISWGATLAHVGYLNGILGLPWYNGVCWTLGIEFQFYLIAAILFPVFSARSRYFLSFVIVATTVPLLAMKFGGVGDQWLLRWASIFVMGISAYRLSAGVARKSEFFLVQLLAAGAAVAAGRWEGAVAGTLSAMVIAFISVDLPRLLAAYAAITYSLYLVHQPIGNRVVHLTQRLGSELAVDMAGVAFGLAASFLAAIVFWQYVERPSLKWAASIKASKPRP